MSTENDLYDVLGIDRDATGEDIKKAYRKKALSTHPDKGGDVELFKKINRAYEVLGNPQKRSMYDNYGTTENINFSTENILSSVIGGLFNKVFNRKAEPIVQTKAISLEELCKRKVVIVSVKRQRVCECDNKGATCRECNGQKFKMEMKQIFPGMVGQVLSPCTTCDGKGKIFKSCNKCTSGVVKEEKEFELYLTPEMSDGYKYILSGEGNKHREGEAGDVEIIIQYKKHKWFQVKDKDLTFIKTLSLKEALTGCSFDIIHPSGEIIKITNTEVVDPNTVQELPKGLTDEGLLKIQYKIKFPVSLTEVQKEVININF
jgi:DnaJ family protein A protein 2